MESSDRFLKSHETERERERETEREFISFSLSGITCDKSNMKSPDRSLKLHETEREREVVYNFSLYIYLGHEISRSLPEITRNRERERGSV